MNYNRELERWSDVRDMSYVRSQDPFNFNVSVGNVEMLHIVKGKRFLSYSLGAMTDGETRL